MRLPADATLIVISGPHWGQPANLEAEANAVALIAAWRREGLPLVHVGGHSIEPDSPHAPLAGEAVIATNAGSAFAGASLEGLLNELGATTLVLCGAPFFDALEATVRDAGSLGYQVFVVADACGASPLARLEGESLRIVDAATALRAAATAKARERHAAKKGGSSA